jgi:hypothetical protein
MYTFVARHSGHAWYFYDCGALPCIANHMKGALPLGVQAKNLVACGGHLSKTGALVT